MVVFNNLLPIVIAITAMGIDALTVKPAFKARYTLAAPNKHPMIQPITIAFSVTSFMFVSGETNGLNGFGSCITVLVLFTRLFEHCIV